MELKVSKRDIKGSKVKRLREEHMLPAVVYGQEDESVDLKVDYNEFLNVYRQVGESELVELSVEDEDKERAVYVKEVQIEPVSGKPLHVSFFEIDLTEEVTLSVPIHYVDEEEHSEIKNGNAILIPLISEVELRGLPNDIPGSIELEIIGKLEEIGDVLTAVELKYAVGDDVEVLIEDDDMAIAKLEYPEMEEEPEEEELTEEELIGAVEVEGEDPEEGVEGEAPEEAEEEQPTEEEENNEQ